MIPNTKARIEFYTENEDGTQAINADKTKIVRVFWETNIKENLYRPRPFSEGKTGSDLTFEYAKVSIFKRSIFRLIAENRELIKLYCPIVKGGKELEYRIVNVEAYNKLISGGILLVKRGSFQ